MSFHNEDEPHVERRIAVLCGVAPDLIKDVATVAQQLHKLSRDAWGLNLVGEFAHKQFAGDENPLSPHEDGVTAAEIYAESHGVFSTWPNSKRGPMRGVMHVDVATCSAGEKLDEDFEESLLRAYHPKILRSSLILPDESGFEDVVRRKLFTQSGIHGRNYIYIFSEGKPHNFARQEVESLTGKKVHDRFIYTQMSIDIRT